LLADGAVLSTGQRDGRVVYQSPEQRIPRADAGDPETSFRVWAASQKGVRDRFDPAASDGQRVKFANPVPLLKRLLAHLASHR